MFNLQKYNMACVLINDAIENLPSSNLQAVFFQPQPTPTYNICYVLFQMVICLTNTHHMIFL